MYTFSIYIYILIYSRVQGNMTIIIYIYIYLYIDVRGEPNSSKYTKTKNHLSNIFGLSFFFVEEPPQYLLQGGRKLALIIYIYIYQNINIRGCVSAKRLQI